MDEHVEFKKCFMFVVFLLRNNPHSKHIKVSLLCSATMYCPLAIFLFSGFYTLVSENEERYLVIYLTCGFWIRDKYKAIFNRSQTVVLSV